MRKTHRWIAVNLRNAAGRDDENEAPAEDVAAVVSSGLSLLLTIEEVSQVTSLSVRQIHRLKSMGVFPKEIRIGGSDRWRRCDIQQWVADGCPKLDNRR